MKQLLLILMLIVLVGSGDTDNEPPLPETVRPGGLPGIWWNSIGATGPALQVVVALHRHDGTGPLATWRKATHATLLTALQTRGIALLQLDVRKADAAAVAGVLNWLKEKRRIHPLRVGLIATDDLAPLATPLRDRVGAVFTKSPTSAEAIDRALDRVLLDGVIDAVDGNRRATLNLARGASLTVGYSRGGLYLGLRVRPNALRRLARMARVRVDGRVLPLPPGGVWGPPGGAVYPPPGDSVYEVLIPHERLGAKAGEPLNFAFALDGKNFFPTALALRPPR